MTHPLLILNPSSGRELADEAAGMLEAGLRQKYGGVRVVRTGGDGHAREGARAAAAAGCTRIFVGGGDGTVNEALNGVVDADALGRVRLGIVPLGTGNDFATGLGIPPEVDGALAVLLEERELKVDVGVVNGRHFLNTSGGGYIAEVSVAVTPQLKTIAGRMAYLIGGAQALIEYEPLRATVSAEPGEVRLGLGLYAFAVCNSRLIGGGKIIAPEAIVDDGLLDLCLIEDMTAVEFVALGRKVADGDHIDDPRVRYIQASSIRIQFDRDALINTDGEAFEASVCEYSVLHRAATFFAGAAPFAAVSAS